jgi:phosphoribosylaminoimidazole-succinocarboxamide synthase
VLEHSRKILHALSDSADPRLRQPSTKAPAGEKDENISPEEARKIIGDKWAGEIEKIALKVYKAAYDYAVSNLRII